MSLSNFSVYLREMFFRVICLKQSASQRVLQPFIISHGLDLTTSTSLGFFCYNLSNEAAELSSPFYPCFQIFKIIRSAVLCSQTGRPNPNLWLSYSLRSPRSFFAFFFSLLAALFSSLVFAGSFLEPFFRSWPLLMTFSFVGFYLDFDSYPPWRIIAYPLAHCVL